MVAIYKTALACVATIRCCACAHNTQAYRYFAHTHRTAPQPTRKRFVRWSDSHTSVPWPAPRLKTKNKKMQKKNEKNTIYYGSRWGIKCNAVSRRHFTNQFPCKSITRGATPYQIQTSSLPVRRRRLPKRTERPAQKYSLLLQRKKAENKNQNFYFIYKHNIHVWTPVPRTRCGVPGRKCVWHAHTSTRYRSRRGKILIAKKWRCAIK